MRCRRRSVVKPWGCERRTTVWAALASEQRARRETEQASYVKDEFLMTVSHELRDAADGHLRLVAAAGDGAAARRARAPARLPTIERNARAQTRLIDDLLDVSRVITGKLRLDIRQVNLEDIVRGAVEAMRPALAARASGSRRRSIPTRA